MNPEKALSRRRFLQGNFLTSLQSKTVQQQGFQGIRPPWAVDNSLFIENCTRCGDCIHVCETRILVKGEGDFPEVHFDDGECTFCQKCVEVCQQPIFRPVTEQAWTHRVAIGEECLTFRGVECRSCEDSCETRAIRFKPVLGQVSQISLNLENCNGCGACLKSCPALAIKISHLD